MSMIYPADIQAAIVSRLLEAFPGETIYEDLAPRDFTRPCHLVEPTALELDPLSTGQGCVRLAYQYRITTFSQVDEVHNSHLPELTARAARVLMAFAAGWLRVKDRAPKITSLKSDTSSYDSAEIILTLSIAVDRSELVTGETFPMMENFHTRYIERDK